MTDRVSLGLDNEPDHSHPFQLPGISDLMQLARAMGGGSYPGLGAGQNDSLGFPDSIAPGFPLNIPFVIPGNLVKQQAYKLSFIPAPYRNYAGGGSSGIPTTAHAHSGDTVQTLSIDHTHATGNELSTHKHQLPFDSALTGTAKGTVSWETGATGWGNALYATTDPLIGIIMYSGPDSGSAGDHAHTANTNNGAVLTSHTHTSVSNTGGEQTHIHAGGAATPLVTEGTSPDAIRVVVDGIDATTQLGGPWTNQQFELDVTPFVGPGSGIHTVQIKTATQLGRVTGWVRQANIVNALSP